MSAAPAWACWCRWHRSRSSRIGVTTPPDSEDLDARSYVLLPCRRRLLPALRRSRRASRIARDRCRAQRDGASGPRRVWACGSSGLPGLRGGGPCSRSANGGADRRPVLHGSGQVVVAETTLPVSGAVVSGDLVHRAGPARSAAEGVVDAPCDAVGDRADAPRERVGAGPVAPARLFLEDVVELRAARPRDGCR